MWTAVGLVRYTRGSAMRRAGYSGLRRNVAISLGNWLAGMDAPDPEAVGELVAALSDEDPVVAEAAAGGWGGRGEARGAPIDLSHALPVPSVFPLPPTHTTVRVKTSNFPLSYTSLVGRSRQLTELTTLMADRAIRLVTLVGPPGVGKTRLGLEMAAGLEAAYADGVTLVPLSAVDDPQLVPVVIAEALGAGAAQGDPWSAVGKTLADRDMLLLLDNFEQVSEAATELALLLGAAPRVTLLITSRVALRISAEYTYRVPPLELPEPGSSMPTSELAHVPSIALFLERSKAAGAGIRLTEENADTIASICRCLDGLPLAIELAAVRTKLLSPDALLVRLSDRLGTLGRSAPDLPARQRTLRAALEWSYELLDPRERLVFRTFSVFAGGVSLEAISSVLPPPDARPDSCGHGSARGRRAESHDTTLLDVLETLVDHSLLQAERGWRWEPRFTMLHVLREFAMERLRAEDGEEAVRVRHVRHFLSFAEAHGGSPAGGSRDGVLDDAQDPDEGLDQLETERDNLRTAMAWAIDSGDATAAVRLAASLWRFWRKRGSLSDGRRWVNAALALSGGPGGEATAEAEMGAGVLARFQGEIPEALDRLQRSEVLWREMGASRGLSEALTYLGMAENYIDHLDAARGHLDEAVALWRSSGNRRGLAHALSVRAGLANHEGDHDLAEALRHESLQLARTLGDRGGIGRAMLGLGEIARKEDDLATACDWYEQALAVFREIGDRYHEGAALHNLGYVVRRRGAHDAARRTFAEALDVFEEIGHRLGFVSCVTGLSGVLLDAGEAGDAARLWAAADAWRRSLGRELLGADRAEWEEIEARLAESLGRERLEVLRRQAQQTTWREVVELGRAVRGTGPAPSAHTQLHEGASDPTPAPGAPQLSAREVEVLTLLGEGLTYAQIGRRLFISARTVDAHLRSAYPKLGVRSRHAAVEAARAHGLIPGSGADRLP